MAFYYSRKGSYNSKNYIRFLKSEKYEPFFVSKLLIWRQKWIDAFRQGNKLVHVVRRLLPGGNRYAILHQINHGILKVAKATYALSIFFLAAKKKAVIVSFR